MREISVFDVIGPNMIGPSSSHTAGALRIASMAHRLMDGPVKKIRFILYGSFARTYHGHGTDRALLGGMLGFSTEDRRIRDSFRLADEAGIQYVFECNTTEQDVHPNTVKIIAEDRYGKITEVVGESIGGGNARLRQINGVSVDIAGELQTVVVQQLDTPGVIAHITQCLYEEGINIAYLNVYRENKNEHAYSVIEADGELPASLAERLKKIPAVLQVNLIKL
ncbi:MAG: L-serine ammonia-lyase, iron-sulfur-dependent subunit beta [Firmicutes bacterium]|nr:L-serine ammonia-lyase, iron-sulfur-dependent subunit beta [Bacillota bacterium]